MVGLNVLGKKLIILNSYEAAVELLEKRNAIYSSRPPLPLIEQQYVQMQMDHTFGRTLTNYGFNIVLAGVPRY